MKKLLLSAPILLVAVGSTSTFAARDRDEGAEYDQKAQAALAAPRSIR